MQDFINVDVNECRFIIDNKHQVVWKSHNSIVGKTRNVFLAFEWTNNKEKCASDKQRLKIKCEATKKSFEILGKFWLKKCDSVISDVDNGNDKWRSGKNAYFDKVLKSIFEYNFTIFCQHFDQICCHVLHKY